VGLVCCVVVALAENDYLKNSPQRVSKTFVSFVCSVVVALAEND